MNQGLYGRDLSNNDDISIDFENPDHNGSDSLIDYQKDSLIAKTKFKQKQQRQN